MRAMISMYDMPERRPAIEAEIEEAVAFAEAAAVPATEDLFSDVL